MRVMEEVVVVVEAVEIEIEEVAVASPAAAKEEVVVSLQAKKFEINNSSNTEAQSRAQWKREAPQMEKTLQLKLQLTIRKNLSLHRL